jgi:hypothetical protein
MLSVRSIAEEFGRKFGIEPIFTLEESDTALLSNATKAHELFGCPTVSVAEVIEWVADWVQNQGPMLNKPTHFATRDGKF